MVSRQGDDRVSYSTLFDIGTCKAPPRLRARGIDASIVLSGVTDSKQWPGLIEAVGLLQI
jgi:hypothetical protein